MSYLIIKHLHITLAFASICFFCVRFAWSISNSAQLQQKWVRVFPHIVDTLLLSLGLYLMIVMKLWPTEHPWLATKLIALVVYILLGTFAIKRGKTKIVKWGTGILAILVYVYMINVAISHNPYIVF